MERDLPVLEPTLVLQGKGQVGLVSRRRTPYMVSSRLARPCAISTGTGLLSYIRPVGEGPRPSGLDEVRAYRPYRPIGVVEPPSG